MNINNLDTEAKWSRLNTVFDVSSEKNRNLLMLLIVVSAYVISISMGVSDIDLLLGSGAFEMPLIGAKVSIEHFFVSASIIVFLLHVNMLANLSEHLKILRKWKSINGTKSHKFPYMINLLVLEERRAHQNKTKLYVLRFLVFCSVLLLPTCALLCSFWRFADYQSIVISYLQLSLLAISIMVSVSILSRLSIPMFSGAMDFSNKGFSGPYVVIIALVSLYQWLALIMVIVFPTWVWWLVTDNGEIVESRLSFFPMISIDSKQLSTFKPEYRISLNNTQTPNSELIDEWKRYNGVDLSGRNLVFAIFDNIDGQKTNFKNANLFAASFNKARTAGSKFDGAILAYTNFGFASSAESSFIATNIASANFNNASLQSSDFSQSKLSDSSFRNAFLSNSEFFDAQMNDSDFSLAEMYGVSLKSVIIDDVKFNESELSGSDFSDTKATKSQFDNAEMLLINTYKTDFVDSSMNGVNFMGADIKQTDFTDSKMFNVNFTGAELTSNLFLGCKSNNNAFYAVEAMDVKNVSSVGCYEEQALASRSFNNMTAFENLQYLKLRMNTLAKKTLDTSLVANRADERIDRVLSRLECENKSASSSNPNIKNCRDIKKNKIYEYKKTAAQNDK